jgi:hypothetical protein
MLYLLSLVVGLATLAVTRKLALPARVVIAAAVCVGLVVGLQYWILSIGDKPLPGSVTVVPAPPVQESQK